VAVLIIPGAILGPLVGACCGVEAVDYEASAPVEACVGDEVTIEGSYGLTGDSSGLTISVGAMIDVWNPGGTQIVDEDVIVASGISMPDSPPPVEFDYDFDVDEVGTYAWTATVLIIYSDGARMELNALGGTIEVEQCSEVDIKPGSCPNAFNTKEKGVLPVGITGGENFDASLVSSVSILGLTPVKFEIKDSAMPGMTEGPGCNDCVSYELTPIYDDSGAIIGYEADGIADYIAYFDAQAVAAALGSVAKGDCITIKVDYTYEGEDFTDFDTLKIVK
jgi:hypothetical protein